MASRRRVAKAATEGLKILWDNHFPDAELGMALLRADHLTRRGKRGSYEYIQKYPFIEDEGDAPARKKGGKK